MKKDLITHFFYTAAFFLLISLTRNWFDLHYYPLWIGALIGTILPDVDYLIYIYFLRPDDQVSQTASDLISKRSVVKSWDLLVSSRNQYPQLIFHTAYFQIIFLLFTFWAVTSVGSLLGRGIILAFSLHLLVDQAMDFFEMGGVNHWFRKMNMELTPSQQKWWMLGNVVLLAIFGFVF